MLLKLVMSGRDYDGRWIERASIVKWYRREGDWVDYGDDLLDVEVQQVRSPDMQDQLRNEIISLNERPSHIADLAARQLAGQPPALGEIDPEHLIPWDLQEWVFVVRITSSDRGVLRRICASEGERRRAGEALAILATDAAEPLPATTDALATAALFRTVTNTENPFN